MRHFLYVCHLTKIQSRQKVTRPKIISWKVLPLGRLEIYDRKVFCCKGDEDPLELAGGLTSTSSWIFYFFCFSTVDIALLFFPALQTFIPRV